MFLGASKYDVILDNFGINKFNVDKLEGVFKITECPYQNDLLDEVGKTIYIELATSSDNETIELDISIQEKGFFVPEYEMAIATRLLKDGIPTADSVMISDDIMASIKKMYSKTLSDIDILGWNSELKVISNLI